MGMSARGRSASERRSGLAEKSSVFKGAPSSDDVAWGIESADNAITAVAVGGAVAAGVATKVMPKGMKRRLQRKKSWVKRKTKRCKERYPLLVKVVSLANSVLSLALYFLDVFTDVNLCIAFYWNNHMVWGNLMVVFIALPYVVAMFGIAFYSYKENEGIVRAACVFFSPVLPALCDVYMPFYSLLQNVGCVPDVLTNFMVQYEATRTLSETVLETIPQMVLQVNIYIYCAGNAGNCEGIDQEAGSALAQSLAVGGVCIVYRLVLVYYEMKAEGLGLLGYLKSLVQLGAGLPLRAITGNTVKELRLPENLEEAQVRSLAVALKSNTSIETINGLPPVKWSIMKEERRAAFDVMLSVDHFMSQWNTVKYLRLPENLEEAQVRSLAWLEEQHVDQAINGHRQSHGLRWG